MEKSATIQAGFVEDEAFEIIDLIHCYSLSADFSHWITNGKFTHKLIQEHLEKDKYSRIFQYKLNGSIFVSGANEFYVDKISKETVDIIVKNRAPLYVSKASDFSKMRKIYLSKVIAEPHYNVISHLYINGDLVGTSWEVYDLPRLIHIYKGKEDPIRYWRKTRRE